MSSEEIIAQCDARIKACEKIKAHFAGTTVLSNEELEEQCEVIQDELNFIFNGISNTLKNIQGPQCFS